MSTIQPGARPRLARGVRLHEDAVEGPLLLAPERVLKLNASARAILARCDGTRTFEEIVGELRGVFSAPREVIAADAGRVLDDLAGKRMVEL